MSFLSQGSEHNLSQSKLKDLYTGLDDAVKRPDQWRHSIEGTNLHSPTAYHQIDLDEDESRIVLQDDVAQSILVRVTDPIDPDPYREHKMLVEFHTGTPRYLSETRVRGVAMYTLHREISRGAKENYSLLKYPFEVEDIPDTPDDIDLFNTNMPYARLSKVEQMLDDEFKDRSRKITLQDIEMLQRLAKQLMK